MKNSSPYRDRRPLWPGEIFGCYARAGRRRGGERDGVIRRETNRKKMVRKSLEDQLKAKGADIDLFLDQINDYMTMWDLKEKLKEDIAENGLRLMYRTANGSKAEKDNPSVKQIPLINKQMLMLLKQLEISTDNAARSGDDRSDDL